VIFISVTFFCFVLLLHSKMLRTLFMVLSAIILKKEFLSKYHVSFIIVHHCLLYWVLEVVMTYKCPCFELHSVL